MKSQKPKGATGQMIIWSGRNKSRADDMIAWPNEKSSHSHDKWSWPEDFTWGVLIHLYPNFNAVEVNTWVSNWITYKNMGMINHA